MSTASGSFSLALLRRLISRPELAGTQSVIIKGGALEAGGYNRGDRFFVDVDLVIDPNTLEQWERAVAACGAQWRLGDASGYELAYVTSEHAMIELHAALPGMAGSDHGPSYATLKSRSVEVSDGLLIPFPQVCREIAVEHFVAHHNGDPGHALKTIQDLVALEEAGEGEGLEWHGAPIAASVARFRGVGRAARDGEDETEPEAKAFFDGLLRMVLEGQVSAATGFSDSVDHWITMESAQGRSRVSLMARRLFPPIERMRLSAGEAPFRTATRYAIRPAVLLFRYLGGALHRVRHPSRTAELKRWRALLARDRSGLS